MKKLASHELALVAGGTSRSIKEDVVSIKEDIDVVVSDLKTDLKNDGEDLKKFLKHNLDELNAKI